MYTSIKFNHLAGLPEDQRNLALKQAIQFEFAKANMALDGWGLPIARAKGALAANEAKFDAPTIDMCKAALLKRPDVLLGEEGAKDQKTVDGLKYATASDNPILTDLASEFAAFFHSNMPTIDTGWMSLYDLVDLRNSPHDHFDIDDTNAGITYTQITSGDSIKKVTKIAEARSQCQYATFGAGLGILDDWITKQMFWRVDEAVNEFRAQHFDNMAKIHYQLFTALSSSIDQAFSTDDPTTFNAGAAKLIRNLRTAGYGVGQNAAFTILCAPEKVGRIKAMLQAQQGSQMVAFGTVKQPIAFTVQSVISSTWISSSDTGYYLILPGKKLKRGVWQDLSIEQQRNSAQRATDWFASAQYNAIIGDTNQVVRVKYS